MNGARPGFLTIGRGSGTVRVSTLLLRPARAGALLVLGHGAGAGMRHPFLEGLARLLAEKKVATFRYQFPYMERGSARPDPPPLLLATTMAAVRAGSEAAPDLPLFAGGKSMGGRITSMAAAEGSLGEVRGLIFLGYPLHAPGRTDPATLAARSRHLSRVSVPMLFLQGTRDRLAEKERIGDVCARLGPRAELVWVEGADHSFHVLKRSGRTDEEVLAGLAATAAGWMGR